MRIKLASIEDALDNIGFRKVSAFIKTIHPETDIHYVVTGNHRSLLHTLLMRGAEALAPDDMDRVARSLAEADIVGFSSMTQYASIVVDLIERIRHHNPKAFIVWGGIHPIIEPDDAIQYADAICTGEGEFAFEMFLNAYKAGTDYTTTPGFWFNTPAGIFKNKNLPLMTNEQMDTLPVLTYQDSELIYRNGQGFAPINYMDFINFSGLSYNTVWSIGCPFKCTYCGNSTFIGYDANYRKIRHSSVDTLMKELKSVTAKHPHITSICFHDDSFMAMPYRMLEEFCEAYTREINLPFAVFGVIPNYVREDKVALLVSAGMNRVRMGIQSGSERVLDFYQRPTPIDRIKSAAATLSKYSRYMVPPTYDMILDNPIETVEDTRATLDMFYSMPRPYGLNIYSLRVIPNSQMAATIKKMGIEVTSIRSTFSKHIPSIGNLLIYLMVTFPLPPWFYEYFRGRVEPSCQTEKLYPKLLILLRLLYYGKRSFQMLRFMDFSSIPGIPGYILFKLGVVKYWHRHMVPKLPKDQIPVLAPETQA